MKKKKPKKRSVECNHYWIGQMTKWSARISHEDDFYVVRSCNGCGLSQYFKGKWVRLKKEQVL